MVEAAGANPELLADQVANLPSHRWKPLCRAVQWGADL